MVNAYKNKIIKNTSPDFLELERKAKWVRKETIKLHHLASGIRIASNLSSVEIFVVLYFGRILKFDPRNIFWSNRDRFIVSKGHGAVSLFPIFADLGFFKIDELSKISTEESFLGSIPDITVPGIETTNGSSAHGLGIACGMALAMKYLNIENKVYVLLGDGELNSGAIWEAVMFASFHKLNNLIAIVDDNKKSMLGYQRDILGLDPIDEKFKTFKWIVEKTNGHDVGDLYEKLKYLKADKSDQPKLLIADTIKGKGVPELEQDELAHVRILNEEEIERVLSIWK